MISHAVCALVKIELPGGPTIRLCDGGVITWGAETFRQRDATFGAAASLAVQAEGMGDEIPAIELTLLPDKSAAAGDLWQPGFQTARARFWIADYTVATGAVSGTPELMFDGFLDQCVFSVGQARRDLVLTIVSRIEKLFEKSIGNNCSPSFHKRVWPGEKGHDNLSKLNNTIAWGAAYAPGTDPWADWTAQGHSHWGPASAAGSGGLRGLW